MAPVNIQSNDPVPTRSYEITFTRLSKKQPDFSSAGDNRCTPGGRHTCRQLYSTDQRTPKRDLFRPGWNSEDHYGNNSASHLFDLQPVHRPMVEWRKLSRSIDFSGDQPLRDELGSSLWPCVAKSLLRPVLSTRRLGHGHAKQYRHDQHHRHGGFGPARRPILSADQWANCIKPLGHWRERHR